MAEMTDAQLGRRFLLGLGALFVVGIAGAVYVQVEHPSLWPDGSNAHAPSRDEGVDEEIERDSRRERVRTAVCTVRNDQLFTHVTHRFMDEAGTDTMAVVAVRPKLWAGMNIDAKARFAGWAAVCQRSKDRLRIIDGNSGDDLKLWSLDGGLL